MRVPQAFNKDRKWLIHIPVDYTSLMAAAAGPGGNGDVDCRPSHHVWNLLSWWQNIDFNPLCNLKIMAFLWQGNELIFNNRCLIVPKTYLFIALAVYGKCVWLPQINKRGTKARLCRLGGRRKTTWTSKCSTPSPCWTFLQPYGWKISIN